MFRYDIRNIVTQLFQLNRPATHTLAHLFGSPPSQSQATDSLHWAWNQNGDLNNRHVVQPRQNGFYILPSPLDWNTQDRPNLDHPLSDCLRLKCKDDQSLWTIPIANSMVWGNWASNLNQTFKMKAPMWFNLTRRRFIWYFLGKKIPAWIWHPNGSAKITLTVTGQRSPGTQCNPPQVQTRHSQTQCSSARFAKCWTGYHPRARHQFQPHRSQLMRTV